MSSSDTNMLPHLNWALNASFKQKLYLRPIKRPDIFLVSVGCSWGLPKPNVQKRKIVPDHLDIVQPAYPEKWNKYRQVSRPPMSSSDWDLTFTWCSPDVHLTTWPLSDLPLTLTKPLPNLDCWLGDFELHLNLNWRSPGIPWPSSDLPLTLT